MDFSNEPYVRIYTSVTPRSRLYGFWGRVLMDELVKHSDRAGVIDLPEEFLDDLPMAVASVIGCDDVEWVRKHLPKLMLDPSPSVVQKDRYLLIPRYRDAQYGTTHPKMSAKLSRKKKADIERAEGLGLIEPTTSVEKTA